MNWLKKAWRVYIRWCDDMGLTPENKRSCIPREQIKPQKDSSPRSAPPPSND